LEQQCIGWDLRSFKIAMAIPVAHMPKAGVMMKFLATNQHRLQFLSQFERKLRASLFAYILCILKYFSADFQLSRVILTVKYKHNQIKQRVPGASSTRHVHAVAASRHGAGCQKETHLLAARPSSVGAVGRLETTSPAVNNVLRANAPHPGLVPFFKVAEDCEADFSILDDSQWSASTV